MQEIATLMKLSDQTHHDAKKMVDSIKFDRAFWNQRKGLSNTLKLGSGYVYNIIHAKLPILLSKQNNFSDFQFIPFLKILNEFNGTKKEGNVLLSLYHLIHSI
jgi:hypothetical protein